MPQFFSALLKHRSAVASGATVTVAAVAVSTMAFLYQGVPTADVQLDDGGVWVTKSQGENPGIGHFNYSSSVLDGAVAGMLGRDVLQDGDTVYGTAAGSITRIDPATLRPQAPLVVPDGAHVALGGDTIAVAGKSGLFILGARAASAPAYDEDDALADVGEGADVAVSHDGATVVAVSKEHKRLIVLTVADGSVRTVPLKDVAADADLTVTAVGDRPVAFDSANGVLFLPDGSAVDLPSARSGALQQTGAADDAVYVETATALLRQPLGGGDVQMVATARTATPSAPVRLNGCTYALWSSPAQLVTACDGRKQRIEEVKDAGHDPLVLRQNRRAVVINDLPSGAVWTVDDPGHAIDEWPQPSGDEGDDDTPETIDETQRLLPPPHSKNTRPHAVDDLKYTARAGRATILRVTDNDTDADGDLLSATPVASTVTGDETVSPVLGGAALQLDVPPNTAGRTIEFDYIVDDGRESENTDEAHVVVQVVASDANSAPTPPTRKTVQVEAGATASYNALDGWKDPDGDDLFLVSATLKTPGDSLTYRSNGMFTFTASSLQAGVKDVDVVVSDGTAEAKGVVSVEVKPKGSLSPIANSDRVAATVGIPVTISPIANDISPNGQPLQLVTAESTDEGVELVTDYTSDTVRFTAHTPGPHYIGYTVSAGTTTANGLIRVDVADANSKQPPVAVRDLALLPAGRSVLVDVLANDTDPSGGILVLQSAEAAPGVSVEVLQHSILRITDLTGISVPVVVKYSISNGESSATGEVLVMSVPQPKSLRPPVAVADTAIVRAGDVVTIPVLENDYHPDNDVFHLDPTLTAVSVGGGTIFTDGDDIRLLASSKPGTYEATYSIQDSQHHGASAVVTIQVVDGDAHSAPTPRPVTARVVAGSAVRIPLPLDGIDADGDSVQLTGLGATLPTKGRAEVGDGWITYTAAPDEHGSDSFTYGVRDHRGDTAEGTVTVGIAQPGIGNQAPYAVQDVVAVQPGRRVSVDVTANDSDPDGDDIALVTGDGAFEAPDGVAVAVTAGRVVVTVPTKAGEYPISYTIEDVYGAQAHGSLVVDVSGDAPLQAPIARDDVITPVQVEDDLSVDVPVLANDEDPDGTADALTVDVPAGEAIARPTGVVGVKVGPKSQIIRYTVTDADGGIGQAFIFVPAASALAPELKRTEPLKVPAGTTVDIPLSEWVHVRSGHVARAATASVVASRGTPAVSADPTVLTYTAPDEIGPDGVRVQVTDGSGPDDGLQAFLLIPIEVTSDGQTSPTMQSAVVSVGQGEAAQTVDLRKLAYDPDEGDELSFDVSSDSPADGVRIDRQGTTLSVSAEASAQLTKAPIEVELTVTDKAGHIGSAKLSITVVKSVRPLPIAVDDLVPEADQGRTVSVPVLDNDFDPFAADGKGRSLKILGDPALESGEGTAKTNGDAVDVTPAPDFFGTLVFSYRITDATGLATRQAQARIIVTVQGKPAAPAAPTVVSVGDSQVVLTWIEPENHGSRITGYRITSSRGDTMDCPVTTCTFTGLKNDTEYTFTVVAINDVGESKPSSASIVARPDREPDQPAAPTLDFAPQSLKVAWVTPHSSGSPVLSYNLEIEGPTSGAAQRTATGNALVWDGLQNGASYRIRVQAVNRASRPSEWSAWSAPMVPADVPDAPGKPSASFAPSVGSQAQITVTWQPPAHDNGATVDDYTVVSDGGDGVVRSVTVSGTTATIAIVTSSSPYTFTVTARNKAGSSSASARSNSVQAVNAPDAPTSVTIAPSGATGGLRVDIAPGAANGNAAAGITWHWSGAGGRSGQIQVQSQSASAVSGVITGAQNGAVQSVSVWGVSSAGGVGEKTTSNSAKPYGPLGGYTPAATASGGKISFSWDLTAALNGQEFVSASYSISGGGSGSTSITGNAASVSGYYADRTISLTVRTAEGNQATYQATANTGADPNRRVTVSRGTKANVDGCSSTSCGYVYIEISGFAPNTRYSDIAWTNCQGYGAICTGGAAMPAHMTAGAFSITTDASGHGSANANVFGFPGADVWAIVGGVESNHYDWPN